MFGGAGEVPVNGSKTLLHRVVAFLQKKTFKGKRNRTRSLEIMNEQVYVETGVSYIPVRKWRI